jgi:parvulin-like peptidyl-prolyl isomerase
VAHGRAMRARPPRFGALPGEKRIAMTFLFRAIPLVLAALFLIAAGEPPPPANDVVAQRGDVRLSAADLKDALSLLDPAARAQVTANPQALANFVRERILNMAVLAEAASKNWDKQPDVQKRIAETRDAVILQTYLASLVPPDPAYPSEAEVTTAYENNKARLVIPKQYHIAQIVFLVKPGATPQEEEEVRKKAADLRAQAMRPKADFTELAKKNSQEVQSADKGGDVGWLREPDMIPAVRDVVSGMAEGAISQAVRVPDGWHVLKLLGVRPAGEVPLLDAKPQIVTALRQARAQRLMRAYLDDMIKAQPIQVNEIEVTKQLSVGK